MIVRMAALFEKEHANSPQYHLITYLSKRELLTEAGNQFTDVVEQMAHGWCGTFSFVDSQGRVI